MTDEAEMSGAVIELAIPVRIIRDSTYERSIDSLIADAEDVANETVGHENIDKPEYSIAWTEAFHSAMDRMAAARGLRRASWLVGDVR